MCGRYYFAFEDSVPFQRLQYKVEQKALFEYAREMCIRDRHRPETV